jgi:predicted RNA binding protein YcfA (HicA-like mRNA interferase family)
MGLGVGAGKHGLRAAQRERTDLCRRRSRLGGLQQRLGERQRTLNLRVACHAQARVTRSHTKMVALWCSTPAGPTGVPVPVHGNRPIKRGTLGNIFRAAGINREEFERLL